MKKEKKIRKWKKRRKALWITVVIHSAFGCGGTMIPQHHLDVCTRWHACALPRAYKTNALDSVIIVNQR
jgi:hypothetical protein